MRLQIEEGQLTVLEFGVQLFGWHLFVHLEELEDPQKGEGLVDSCSVVRAVDNTNNYCWDFPHCDFPSTFAFES